MGGSRPVGCLLGISTWASIQKEQAWGDVALSWVFGAVILRPSPPQNPGKAFDLLHNQNLKLIE